MAVLAISQANALTAYACAQGHDLQDVLRGNDLSGEVCTLYNYVCTYIHIHTHTHMHLYVYILYKYIYIYIYIYICTSIWNIRHFIDIVFFTWFNGCFISFDGHFNLFNRSSIAINAFV